MARDHSAEEGRYLTTGYSSRHRVIIVCHTHRGHRIRIISARVATNKAFRSSEAVNEALRRFLFASRATPLKL